MLISMGTIANMYAPEGASGVVHKLCTEDPQDTPKILPTGVEVDGVNRAYRDGCMSFYSGKQPPLRMKKRAIFMLALSMMDEIEKFAAPMQLRSVADVVIHWACSGWVRGVADHKPEMPRELALDRSSQDMAPEEVTRLIIYRLAYRSAAMQAWEHVGRFMWAGQEFKQTEVER